MSTGGTRVGRSGDVAARDDWFRSLRWSPEIQDEFDRRWRRARSDSSRAQYLLIQGMLWSESPDPSTSTAGRELLERVLDEFPYELGDTNRAIAALTHYWESQGEIERAIAVCREPVLLGLARRKPRDPNAVLFASIVVRHDVRRMFAEALERLDAHGRPIERHSIFPIHVFTTCAVESILRYWQGDTVNAIELRDEALRAAARVSSDSWKLPGVGLVDLDDRRNAELYELLGQVSG